VYYDSKPCQVCGSQVELRAASTADIPDADGPVGPRDGYVGGGDPTVDTRICTNPDCPTNSGNADDDQVV
jgi:hypothetical protein